MTYENFTDIYMTHIAVSHDNVLFFDGVKAEKMIKENLEHARRWFNEYSPLLKPVPDKANSVLFLLLSHIAMHFERCGDKSYMDRINMKRTQ